MAWIESHETLARHPKTRKLARLLEEGIPSVIGRLHLLWWWAMNYAPDGDLTKYDPEDIADAVMWDGDPSHVVDALCSAGFLDRTEDGLFVHDWFDYAGRLMEDIEKKRQQNAERQRRFREKQRQAKQQDASNESRNADVTRDSRVTETHSNAPTLPNQTIPNHTTSGGGGDHARTRAEIVQAYEQIYGTLPNPVQVDDLAEYVDKGMETELVIHALRKARRNAKHVEYALGILKRQYERGIRTVAQAEMDDAQVASGGMTHDATAHSGAGPPIRGPNGRKRSIANGRVGEI